MKIILLGPPGAGKGTQAEKLVDYMDAFHLSTGDIFRNNIKNETKLGKKAKSFMDRGELVPDEVTIDLVRDELDNLGIDTDILLDGFPRNLTQAEALTEGLEKRKDKIDKVICIEVDRDKLVSRISGRRVCPVCGRSYHIESKPPKQEGICDYDGATLIQRDDDKEETVKNRIDVYNRETAVLIDYYSQKGILVKIDGTKTPDEVFDEIKENI